MNPEEKEAIKFFYNLRTTIDESNMLFGEDIKVKHGKETIKQITIIINLIEKLQKENEEYSKQLDLDYVDKNYIPILKIKDKIIRNEKIIDISNDVYLILDLYQENKVYEKLLKGVNKND